MEKFKDIKIEAGYLLKVESGEGKKEVHYMTVLPDHRGNLGCCTPGKHWWPLNSFGAEGRFADSEVKAVYGPTCNRLLMDNTPEDRELLWVRKEEQQVVDMTLAEIQEKLGHPFRIVPEKAE